MAAVGGWWARGWRSTGIRTLRGGCRSLASAAQPSAPPVRQRNSVLLLSVPLVAFGLGTWQIFRKQKKEALIAHLHDRLNSKPYTFPADLKNLDDLEYRRVQLMGEFLHNDEIYVGPRTLNREAFTGEASEIGAHVVTPFVLADSGKKILVDRGWVPDDRKDPRTRVEGQIRGQVPVEGIVRGTFTKGSFMPDNEPQANKWYWFDVPVMAQTKGAAPVLVDVVAGREPPGGLPVPGQTKVNIRNEHMQYIFTWYLLSAATLAMWFLVRPGAGGGTAVARRLPPKR